MMKIQRRLHLISTNLKVRYLYSNITFNRETNYVLNLTDFFFLTLNPTSTFGSYFTILDMIEMLSQLVDSHLDGIRKCIYAWFICVRLDAVIEMVWWFKWFGLLLIWLFNVWTILMKHDCLCWNDDWKLDGFFVDV